MKKLLLLIAISTGLLLASASFLRAEDKDGDEILRKSLLGEPPAFVNQTSFPYPFTGAIDQAGVSTGYYFVDSDDRAPDYWRPNPTIVDTTEEPNLWRRIIRGPRQRDPSYWAENPDEGLRFFRNPAMPAYTSPPGNFFDPNPLVGTDSTDDAIAGPIPIGFNFYFNGIRFDSFYVSTNGVIALTNRRYFYDINGQRTIPQGATTCYDPMSLDWFQRGRSGNGLTDGTPDDFGYRYTVLGNAIGYGDLKSGNARGGIRNFTGNLSSFPYRAAVIAPFYGDMHLSQYNPDTELPDDYGKVWFKRSASADKLIIYYVHIMPAAGVKNTPFGTYTAVNDARPWTEPTRFVSASAQVVLNRLDSSVTIIFEEFQGGAQISGRFAEAKDIFRYNTTCGVRGFARHVNFGRGGVPPGSANYPWGDEYEQVTHYYSNYAQPGLTYPHGYLAIKFKQWKNVIRVVTMEYRVRSTDPNDDLDFKVKVSSDKVNNYELLAGEERIGALQPVVVIQNLTNNIQGPSNVNYQEQQLRFRTRFRIVNLATNRVIYNRLINVDSACMAVNFDNGERCVDDPYINVRYLGTSAANPPQPFPSANKYNGVPPYHFAQIYFAPFEPNEYVINHIGRLRAFIIGDPTDPKTNEGLGDQWPFDDTASVRIFAMKRLEKFNDDVTEYHLVEGVPMPSVLKWVNIDAVVVSGNQVSHHPLPPRGRYKSGHGYPDDSGVDRTYEVDSPVIYMNREDLNRQDNSPGDEIRSFPIDLRNRFGAALSLSVQRNVKRDDWARGWCDGMLIGPEPRAVINANVLVEFNTSVSAAARPDLLVVEFAKPSLNGISDITNLDAKNWRNHYRRGGAKPVTNMPAWGIYGGGGQIRGFLEISDSDPAAKDSALDPPNPATGMLNGLRPNIYDDGMDEEYVKAFIAIPDTFINAPNEGAKNFRFRVRLDATDDMKCITCIPDDDDPFFVDNIRLLFKSEVTDLEISAIKVLWPYTQAPASQCSSIPIRIKVANNTSLNAPTFKIRTLIYRKGQQSNYWSSIYCQQVTLPFLTPLTEVEVPMPNWNARKTPPGNYTLVSHLIFEDVGGDLEPLNDTTYRDFEIKFADDFAYDPVEQPTNNVPNFVRTVGRGLNLYGFSEGGLGYAYGYIGGFDYDFHSAGYVGGNGSGQIAMKFKLFSVDTIYGYKAFFGLLNQGLDDIAFTIYTDANGQPGQTEISGSRILTRRGFDDLRNDFFFDQYITYILPKPIMLPAGTYWMSIAQLGETGIELGASSSRVGMRTLSVYIQPPTTSYNRPLGSSGYSLNLDKNFRKTSRTNNLINDNFFAYENTRGSGEWRQFQPGNGNPAYAHLDHFGRTQSDNMTLTLSRGTWIPMLRPYFRERSHGTTYEKEWCEQPPVELTYFNGRSRENGIDLFWETASERNNHGFYIERRLSQANEKWSSLGFVPGNGTTTRVNNYSYFDKESLVKNSTYQYRLRQVDVDGVVTCDNISEVVEVYYGEALTLQNNPNPFTESTMILFNISEKSNVTVEVIDIFGKVVKTLKTGQLAPGQYTTNWNGDNESGITVPSGTYLCRITANNNVQTIKMSLIR